jgi:micrococcal nuclease
VTPRLATLALALALLAGCGGDATRQAAREPPPAAPERVEERAADAAPRAGPGRTCVRVIDGDTVLLDGRERVRLIGVDTPELHREGTPVQYFARQASAFTRGLAEGRTVRLEYERERRDRYGRTLAYVYLEDGTFLNLEIVRRGYGFAYTRHPFRYLDEFRAAERAARAAGAGLWAEPDSIGVGIGPPV